jgi:uncharacterized protein (TIGR00297 family)
VTWLTPAGTVTAVLVGAAVWWGLGWAGLVPLFAFLFSGSLLTRLATGRSAARTTRQVLANGGVAAVAALLAQWPATAGALAAAAADTWATEIGAFSRSPPRSITTGAQVQPGRSGGITSLGTAGGVLGALTLAGVAGLVAPRVDLGIRGAAIATLAGIIGMLSDSLLGATAQAMYHCPVCGAVCERPGTCHEPVRLMRGVRWLDNDAVNLVTTLVGATVAALGCRLVAR